MSEQWLSLVSGWVLSAGAFPLTMKCMRSSKLDITQLQRRDPTAWTILLHSRESLGDLVVTAVSTAPYHDSPLHDVRRQITRYQLALAHHSDPITFLAKRATYAETMFYQELGAELPFLVPRCWLARPTTGQKGWIVLDDVPNHVTPERWSAEDVDAIIDDMANLHALFWDKEETLAEFDWLPQFVGTAADRYTWDELQAEHKAYIEEGPGAIISEHAIYNAGRLAPTFLEAANGLAVMRALGGWPGVLSESHMTATADILDDPVPMLQRLVELPPTLVHGRLHNYQWHVTLFDERRLANWHAVMVGPCVYDLVSFVEQFNLLYRSRQGHQRLITRDEAPVTAETIIDSYILAMNARLGSKFPARHVRQAIPAARCLHVLTSWFPHFARWFADMPNKYMWQKVNRMSDADLQGTMFEPIIGFRPYLSDVFHRFLKSYYML